MKAKKFIAVFFVTFVVALITNIAVSVCWSYFVKDKGLVINWESSVSIVLELAIVIPLVQLIRENKLSGSQK
jgi:hypothetical protein